MLRFKQQHDVKAGKMEYKPMAESEKQITLATGQRAVSLGGSANDTLIVTGNDNIISLNQNGTFHFHLMNKQFLERQEKGAPAAFYDGTRPNWANIANEDDAKRTLYTDLLSFVKNNALPSQRMGIILGLAGEGKTTLLRRLAWDLALEGYAVLWRHSGLAFTTPTPDFQTFHPVILCFDQADEDSNLPELASDLSENGVSFIILATSRDHEWHNADLETSLSRVIHLQSFRLTCLDESEVNILLDCLANAGKLGALENLPRFSQVTHFLDRLNADGQLLPALLTARYGANNFQNIVLDVLKKIHKRHDGEFLVKAYALLAAVHRFGYWLSRSLYAQALQVPVEEIGQRILGPLEGELMEVNEGEGEQLFTRHPIIAECVVKLVEKEHLTPEMRYLYNTLLQALAEYRSKCPDDPQCKLLVMLPKAFKFQGDIVASRQLFQQGVQVDPTNAYIFRAWAIMEKEQGNVEKARELCQQGYQADPRNAPMLMTWAIMEKEQGNIEKARELFQKGYQAESTYIPIWQTWIKMEKEQGNIEKARELCQQGYQADPRNIQIWQTWIKMEKEQGNIEKTRELFQQGTEANPTNVSILHDWAIMEKEQGNIEKARELCQQGYQIDPRNIQIWNTRAIMEKEQGNIEKARELFQQGTEANLTNVSILLDWAIMEKEQGKIEKARELCQQGYQIDPRNIQIWKTRAIMEKEQGNIEIARELFQQGTEANPTNVSILLDWAIMEKEQENIEIARELCQQGYQADPRNAPMLMTWAIMEKEQGNIEKARELFQKGYQIDPRNATILSAWATMEKEQGKIEKAREFFLQGYQIDLRNAIMLMAWATMEKEQGNIEIARVLFQQSVQADPRNAIILGAWATMEKEQGDVEKARELFQQGYQIDPRNAIILGAWAELETLRDNIGDCNMEFCARWLIKKGIDINPNDSFCWTQLADLERKQNNWTQAEQFYLNAANSEKNIDSRARIYFDLSSMFWRIREYDKSNKYLLLSIETNPNDYITHAQLGRRYGFQHNWDKSEEHFKLSLEIKSDDPITQKWYADMKRARE